MTKRLNLEAIQEAMLQAGVNASKLAKSLGVSRTATTQWLSGQSIPRPDKVLKISRLLNLSFEDIYENETLAVNEPVVAYRKKANRKTQDEHHLKAKRMGKVLEQLVPYLPFDQFDGPPRLKNPKNDYDYIQDLVGTIREEKGIKEDAPISYGELIKDFEERQAVLIPVFWGNKENHGNGLHIYLPESQITWVYLNLESHVLDFKYWMAHEMGHILIGENSGIDEEEFCEGFAPALLFTEAAAEKQIKAFPSRRDTPSNIKKIQTIALEYSVSPITVFKELNRYCRSKELPTFDWEDRIYPITAKLNKKIPKVDAQLFDSNTPKPIDYIKKSSEVFGPLFFDALRERLSEVDDGAGLIQWILDIPLSDAKAISQALK